MNRLQFAGAIATTALLWLPGCGEGGSSALEEQISSGVPGVSDVNCENVEGDRYRCTATGPDGKPTVFQGELSDSSP